MKLWSIENENGAYYDDYDSAVVAAETEEIAKTIHPNGSDIAPFKCGDWVLTPEQVSCKYLGEAKEGTSQGVIFASHNAG